MVIVIKNYNVCSLNRENIRFSKFPIRSCPSCRYGIYLQLNDKSFCFFLCIPNIEIHSECYCCSSRVSHLTFCLPEATVHVYKKQVLQRDL